MGVGPVLEEALHPTLSRSASAHGRRALRATDGVLEWRAAGIRVDSTDGPTSPAGHPVLDPASAPSTE